MLFVRSFFVFFLALTTDLSSPITFVCKMELFMISYSSTFTLFFELFQLWMDLASLCLSIALILLKAILSSLLFSPSFILLRMMTTLNCCSITKLFCCKNYASPSRLVLLARLLNSFTLFTLHLRYYVLSRSFIFFMVIFIVLSCFALSLMTARPSYFTYF